MKPEEIKANLNKRVRLNSPRLNVNAEYILTGAIFRKNADGYYYQAELQDLKSNRSILICRLEEIEKE